MGLPDSSDTQHVPSINENMDGAPINVQYCLRRRCILRHTLLSYSAPRRYTGTIRLIYAARGSM